MLEWDNEETAEPDNPAPDTNGGGSMVDQIKEWGRTEIAAGITVWMVAVAAVAIWAYRTGRLG